MSLEIYWKKALEQTRLSIDVEALYPLKTEIITKDFYKKDDFLIRRLDTSKFNKKKIYGPKQNPFCPWEKILVDYGFSIVLQLRERVNLTGIFNFCVDLKVRYHALEKSGF